MNVTTRAAAHLAVLGFGLVSAALHPAAAGAPASASAPATAHVNPAVVRVSFAAAHEAAPAGRPHREGRVQTSGRPRPARSSAHRATTRRTGPTQWPALNAAI